MPTRSSQSTLLMSSRSRTFLSLVLTPNLAWYVGRGKGVTEAEVKDDGGGRGVHGMVGQRKEVTC